MMNTSGGVQRVFEVVGLQQPFRLGALLAGFNLLVQGNAGAAGVHAWRYSNAVLLCGP